MSCFRPVGRLWVGIVLVAVVVGPAARGQEEIWPEGALTLDDCIAIALENQPAIAVHRETAHVAAEQIDVARSYYLPQVDFRVQYTAIDEPRSVTINDVYSGAVGDVFTDAAAFFQIARAAGTTAANTALDNPQTPIFPGGPSFNSVKQQAAANLPQSINVDILGQNFIQSQLRVVQPIWTGGKIRAQYERSQLGAQAAELEVVKTRQLTAFNVARAYFTILLTSDLEQVAIDAAGRSRAVESLARGLLEEGDPDISTVDVYRASTFVHLYREQHVGLARNRQQAYAALKLTMGLQQDQPVTIADRRLPTTSYALTWDEVLGRALARRPELAQANLGVRAAGWQRSAARAELMPDVIVFGGMTTIHDDAHFANPNDDEEWHGGALAQMPLYSGGRRTAQIRQAEHLQVQARAVREQARQYVMQDARDAYLAYREAGERLEAAQEAVKTGMRALDALERQNEGNLIADEDMPKFFEDLLTTRLLTVTAETRYYQALFNYQIALARLQLATASDDLLAAARATLDDTAGGGDPAMARQHIK